MLLAGQPVVTADNFIRVESDAVFTGLVAQGGMGKFYHNRDVTPPNNHVVQRPNRDTLYSTGVFDLDAGPVTITLPDGVRGNCVRPLDVPRSLPAISLSFVLRFASQGVMCAIRCL